MNNLIPIAQQILNESRGGASSSVITKQQFQAEVKRIEGLFKRIRGAKIKFDRTVQFQSRQDGSLVAEAEFNINGLDGNYISVVENRKGSSSSWNVIMGGLEEGLDDEGHVFNKTGKDPIALLKMISQKHAQDLVDLVDEHHEY